MTIVTHTTFRRGPRLVTDDGSNVYAVQDSPALVIKTGPFVSVAEGKILDLVRDIVPVPRVVRCDQDPETGYNRIVMERMKGERLTEAWHGYDMDEKIAVVNQLRACTDAMRRHEHDAIAGSQDGGPIRDAFFQANNRPGPFKHDRDFIDALSMTMQSRGYSEADWAAVLTGLLDVLPTSSTYVLTHGNLNPDNILVQGSLIVAILGWGQSGFYPDYWEFCKTNLWKEYDHPFVTDGASRAFLEPRLAEWSVLLHAHRLIF